MTAEDGKSGALPGGQATDQNCHAVRRVSPVDQVERRPGARELIRSGAVEDEQMIRGNRLDLWQMGSRFDLLERNRQRALDVTPLK
jgi:hypothetical protein